MGDHLKNIKGFFNKQVADVKFRFAGTGRRLNEEGTPVQESTSSEEHVRAEPSQEAQRAGHAALSRLASASTSQNVPSKKSIMVQSQTTRDVSKNENASDQKHGESSRKEKESIVHFLCPLISPEVLTHDEWMIKIKQYLEELVESDIDNPLYTACMIKSVNDPEKASFACEKLKTCLQNILDNPNEEKFKKIKAHNPLFKDKLLPVAGFEQFLLLSGFEYITIDDVKYLIFQAAEEDLTKYIEALDIAQPITLTLDRKIQVKHGYNKQNTTESDDFFKLSKDEVRLEAARRHEEIEDMKVLKTKAMREKTLISNESEFAVVKIKFPDGFSLEGTFKVNETVNDIRQFVLENLKTKDESFNLFTGLGRNTLDSGKTLAEEKLVPSALLYFEWDKEINIENYGYLCEETVALLS